MNSKIKRLEHENEELRKELRKHASMLGKAQKREEQKDELIRKLRHEKDVSEKLYFKERDQNRKYEEERRKFLKENRRITYTNLLTSGKLNGHLAEIEQTARKMVEQTVARMAQAEGVTEELKASDQMKWVGLMNNIRAAAEEVALTELVYADT